MALMEWDINFNTGITTIDQQHKKIIELINRLYNGLKLGENRASIVELLEELIEHTRIHFKTEEDLFIKFEYILTLEHTVEHRRFSFIAMLFNQDYLDGKIVHPLQVIDFLTVWFIDHIVSQDHTYAPFFIEKLKGENL
jgi:hemerythrin